MYSLYAGGLAPTSSEPVDRSSQGGCAALCKPRNLLRFMAQTALSYKPEPEFTFTLSKTALLYKVVYIGK